MAEKVINHDLSCCVCNDKQNLKRCGICKCTYYCSREHQMKDWNNHKLRCKQLAKETSSDVTSSDNIQKDDPACKDVADGRNYGELGKDDSGNKCVINSEKKSSHLQYDTEPDTGIPFDTRPYKENQFIKVPCGLSAVDTAKIAVDELNKNGYCVLDGLFTKSQINKALADIRKAGAADYFTRGKLEGGVTSSDVNKQVVNSEIRSDKIMWIEGTEEDLAGLNTIVSKMDAILWEFNGFLKNKYFINGRTKAMIACYPGNGTYYRRHVDNPSGDGRVVTCILYLNRGWNVQEDGGLLRILPSEIDDYIDIAPVENRLLFFWSDKRSPHEVQPAFKTRYAVTVWYMDQQERQLAKQRNKVGEMDNVHTAGEYILKERQHKTLERDEVTRKIDDTASQAVDSLSLEELEALHSMIDGKPNQDVILADLGIAPNIRDKLLQKLKDLE